MILRTAALVAAMLITILFTAMGAHAGEPDRHASPYAGQESRKIKSLSSADISELRRGGGWGLAKAAELNGVPGPAHLLELKDAIPLTPAQVRTITEIYEAMRAEAIVHGEKLIALEAELEQRFRGGKIDEARLRRSLRQIAEVRQRLRFTHLATHLKTPRILTEKQIAAYARLRGYASDPCAAGPPSGHDPAMWRRHNGCL